MNQTKNYKYSIYFINKLHTKYTVNTNITTVFWFPKYTNTSRNMLTAYTYLDLVI